jgi:hypothetical protein
MDSVIQSPNIRPHNRETFDVDLAAISLEPPLPSTSRNIFAFGTSATWGDNGDRGGSGWGELGLGSLNDGFASSKFVNDGKDVPASFLSLSDKAWGGGSIPGLGGASLSGNQTGTSGG